jgi:signal transduction histidine kinase
MRESGTGVEEHQASYPQLTGRIQWLLRLRWLAVAGTLAAILIANWQFPSQLALRPLLAVVAGIACYNVAFVLVAPNVQGKAALDDRWRWSLALAGAQIVLDLVALTALLHFSGGIENPCVMFLVLHAIIAAILLPRAMSYGVAALASALFVGLGLLEYARLLPHYALPGWTLSGLYRQPAGMLISIAAVVVTLFAAVYMASTIREQLRVYERDLRASSRAAERRSRELEAVTSRLRQVDEERTRFMMLVSHELRAPLNTIFSVLDLATGDYVPFEQAREMLLRAKERVTEMLGLIGELLALAKAREEQFQEAESELTPIGDILCDVVKLMRVEAEKKDLFLGLDIAPDVAPVWINVDRIKLVWTNLLSNALKYTEPGGIIVVTLGMREGRVRGSVRDTGIGIAEDDQPQIFTDFFRTKDARKVSATGTGIGLSLVKRIVENAGGTISFESELGKGTEFTFELPPGA